MASVGTPHTAKLAVQLAYPDPSNVMENVFYGYDPTDGIFLAPATVATDTLNAAIATYLHQVSSNVSVIGATFEDVRTVPFGGVAVSAAPATFGTSGTAGSLPSSTALAVSKHSITLGRSGHGRMYFPVFQPNMLSAPDTIVAASAAAIVAAMVAFQAALAVSQPNMALGFVSYRHAGVARVAGLFVPISSWGISDLAVDTQRRRLLAHNRHR